MATREKTSSDNIKHRKTYNALDSVDQLLLVDIDEDMFGGYRQDLLVSSLNEMQIEFLVCQECKGLMRNACHIGEEQNPVCEVCLTEGVSSQPMMKSRKMIPQLEMKCPLTTRGCKWNGMICEVEEHLNVCPEFVVKCNNDCDVILPRKEIDEHLKHFCTKRIVDCDHCYFPFMYIDLSRHYDVCLEVQIPCPNSCDVIVKRKLLNTHIDTDCPNTLVKCPYRKFGCQQEIKKCELEDHKRVNEIIHLQSTTLFAVSKMEEMELKIQQLEKTIVQLECDKTSNKESKEMGKKVITMTRVLEQLSYPTVLRDFISRDLFNDFISNNDLIFTPIPECFYVCWKFLNLRLVFSSYLDVGLLVTIFMDYDTKKSPLLNWPFEGRFKLTFISRMHLHDSLVYESAVVKLRPKHTSFAKATYLDSLVLAKIPKSIFINDRLVSQDRLSFTLQIQETEEILIMESMKK